jgi:hypothetical protein
LARETLQGKDVDKPPRTPFLIDLEEHIRCALKGTDFDLRSISSMSYRERYEFVIRGQAIMLDFTYTDKKFWSKNIQQVGGDTPTGIELKRLIAIDLGN